MAPALVLAGLCVAAPTGTSVQIMNLFQLVENADKVFWGKCLSAHEQIDESELLPRVEYVFEVQRGLKGVVPGERVTFRQVRPGQGGVVGIPGVPRYRKGQELLLFLHRESRLGLTSPVGLAQGVFRVSENPNGEREAVNPLDNRNLAYRLSPEQMSEAGISPEEVQLLQEGVAVPVSVLAPVIEKIDRHQLGKGRSIR